MVGIGIYGYPKIRQTQPKPAKTKIEFLFTICAEWPNIG